MIMDALIATATTPESMYGRRKMLAHLRRQGHDVSARRVDRLMRELGMVGRVRGKGVRTTIPDRNAARAPDLLDRDFTALAPISGGSLTSPMCAPGPGSPMCRS